MLKYAAGTRMKRAALNTLDDVESAIPVWCTQPSTELSHAGTKMSTAKVERKRRAIGIKDAYADGWSGGADIA